MPDVPHGMLEKLNIVRQMGDRSCANAIDVDIGPPKMRDVSHGILEKLNNMRQYRGRASANAITIKIGPPRMRNIQKADFTQEI